MAFLIGKIEGNRIHSATNLGMFVDVEAEFFERNKNTNEPGYLVIYENNYVSWSPKEVFEAGYHSTDTALDRLKYEYADLQEKIKNLSNFIDNNTAFDQLAADVQIQMTIQLRHMKRYAECLEYRLELWGVK